MNSLFDFSHWTLGDAAFVIWITLWLGLMIRNFRLIRFRTRLLDQVSAAAQRDIEDARPHEWRYREFSSVRYDRMLFAFWKPLELFYPQSPAREVR